MKIDFVSHATLLIELAGGFRILTDPWLDGPAFLGSWIQNPLPEKGPEAFQDIDAVIITHEHSDHLHEPSIEQLPEGVPFFVPSFGYGRLEGRLEKMGRDARPVEPGTVREVSPHFSLSFHNSRKIWFDFAFYLDDGEDVLLNLNDAGIVRERPEHINNVDYLATAFSGGASSYPERWYHIDQAQKEEIIERRNKGLLKIIDQAVEYHEPDVVMPFASYNTLYRNENDDDRRLNEKYENTVEDVKELVGNRAAVLDTSAEKQPVDDLRKAYPPEQYYPNPSPLTRETSREYFDHLFNNHPSSDAVQDYELEIEAADTEEKMLKLIVETKQNRDQGRTAEVHINLPARIAKEVMDRNLSWDEAHIGYWGTYWRHPDQYNVWFWHVLNTPFLAG